jgi:hypothetical protein
MYQYRLVSIFGVFGPLFVSRSFATLVLLPHVLHKSLQREHQSKRGSLRVEIKIDHTLIDDAFINP